MEHLFFPLLGAITVAFFVWIGVLIYKDMRAETFALRKDSWACSMSHTETTTTYIQSGKTLVPMFSTSTVCDQWSRKQ